MIIGITGGTGCGKTTALNVLRDMGAVVIDCDALYHDLLKTDKALLSAIDSRFPGTVTGGILDRKALGAIVFSDEKALSDLNRITHGAIRQAVDKILEQKPPLAAIDAIALLESGLGQLCDFTVAVTAPEEVRVARLMARDGISADYARSRIHAQKSQSYFVSHCDYVLENPGTQEEFRDKCLAFFRNTAIIREND